MMDLRWRWRLAAGVACLLLVAAGIASVRAQSREAAGEWRFYSADAANTKYSPLESIRKENVSTLQIAWRHAAVDPELKQSVRGLTSSNNYRATPLMVGGRLFVQNGLGFAEALDPTTGKVLWTQKPLAPGLEGLVGAAASRGLAYWREGNDERILTVRKNLLFALNAKTGDMSSGFGNGGQINLDLGDDPGASYAWAGSPVIVKDVIVIGSNLSDFPMKKEGIPGHVRGYDVRTGRLRWTFHVVPRPGEFGSDTWENDSWSYTGATNLWSTMSADSDLGYVYLPLSSPTNDWYGGHRLGNNLFSDSLVCLDATTGQRVWHFQIVHHDLWDYDLPTAPILN